MGQAFELLLTVLFVCTLAMAAATVVSRIVHQARGGSSAWG
jgi:uncharacterized membrane protein YccC